MRVRVFIIKYYLNGELFSSPLLIVIICLLVCVCVCALILCTICNHDCRLLLLLLRCSLLKLMLTSRFHWNRNLLISGKEISKERKSERLRVFRVWYPFNVDVAQLLAMQLIANFMISFRWNSSLITQTQRVLVLIFSFLCLSACSFMLLLRRNTKALMISISYIPVEPLKLTIQMLRDDWCWQMV